jgi:hypothetical protein
MILRLTPEDDKPWPALAAAFSPMPAGVLLLGRRVDVHRVHRALRSAASRLAPRTILRLALRHFSWDLLIPCLRALRSYVSTRHGPTPLCVALGSESDLIIPMRKQENDDIRL